MKEKGEKAPCFSQFNITPQSFTIQYEPVENEFGMPVDPALQSTIRLLEGETHSVNHKPSDLYSRIHFMREELLPLPKQNICRYEYDFKCKRLRITVWPPGGYMKHYTGDEAEDSAYHATYVVVFDCNSPTSSFTVEQVINDPSPPWTDELNLLVKKVWSRVSRVAREAVELQRLTIALANQYSTESVSLLSSGGSDEAAAVAVWNVRDMVWDTYGLLDSIKDNYDSCCQEEGISPDESNECYQQFIDNRKNVLGPAYDKWRNDRGAQHPPSPTKSAVDTSSSSSTIEGQDEFIDRETTKDQIRQRYADSRWDRMHTKLYSTDSSGSVYYGFSLGRKDGVRSVSFTSHRVAYNLQLEFHLGLYPNRMTQFSHVLKSGSKSAQTWRAICTYKPEILDRRADLTGPTQWSSAVIESEIELYGGKNFDFQLDTVTSLLPKIQTITEKLHCHADQPYAKCVHDFTTDTVTVYLWPAGEFEVLKTPSEKLNAQRQIKHVWRKDPRTKEYELDENAPHEDAQQLQLETELAWVLMRRSRILLETVHYGRTLHLFSLGQDVASAEATEPVPQQDYIQNLLVTNQRLHDEIDTAPTSTALVKV
eukprot:TRINITY_DN67822_c9_g12_i1.p1 TRINITY_DN67822_c9_g12~~TRINITY_DN67822_c9_g12_i1.p1  ORF type:complete len:697 (-),score=32.75 TRINITY_DN67822_c9_g12_i1:141-1925(-)